MKLSPSPDRFSLIQGRVWLTSGGQGCRNTEKLPPLRTCLRLRPAQKDKEAMRLALSNKQSHSYWWRRSKSAERNSLCSRRAETAEGCGGTGVGGKNTGTREHSRNKVTAAHRWRNFKLCDALKLSVAATKPKPSSAAGQIDSTPILTV